MKKSKIEEFLERYKIILTELSRQIEYMKKHCFNEEARVLGIEYMALTKIYDDLSTLCDSEK